MIHPRRVIFLFAITAFACWIASPVFADLVPSGKGPEDWLKTSGDEQSLADVLDGEYGAGNYVWLDDNSSITQDHLWFWSTPEHLATFTPLAKMSYSHHDFGVYAGTSGKTKLNKLFESQRFKYHTGASFTFSDPESEAFRLGLIVKRGKKDYLSSVPGENADQLDHMHTLKVTGNAGAGFEGNPVGSYVVAWEDAQPIKGSLDFTYQDLIIELSGAQPVSTGLGFSVACVETIPEPTSVVLLGSIAFAAMAWRRRNRNAQG